jgi:hypothetical protein
MVSEPRLVMVLELIFDEDGEREHAEISTQSTNGKTLRSHRMA